MAVRRYGLAASPASPRLPRTTRLGASHLPWLAAIVWQNRAFRFYLAARLLYLNNQYSSAAFCSIQAIELLLKATLVYWDKSFRPEVAGHKISGMVRSVRNKVKDGKSFLCPEYFYRDKRFQSVARYPSNGKGILVPNTFLKDLDTVFAALIELVPFQFNSLLLRTLTKKEKKELTILRTKNVKVRELRRVLGVKLKH